MALPELGSFQPGGNWEGAADAALRLQPTWVCGHISFNDVVKLHNLRCAEYQGQASVLVTDKDSFHMSALRDGAAEDLPEADSPQVSPIEQCVDMEEGEVTLLVKVREVSEDLMK